MPRARARAPGIPDAHVERAHVRLLRHVLCIPDVSTYAPARLCIPRSPVFLRIEVHAGYAPRTVANLALMLQARPTRGLSSMMFRSR